MEDKKSNGKTIIIILLLIIIVILCVLLFLVSNNKIKLNKTKDNKETVTEEKMTEEEALKIGKELYLYADDTYYGGEEVWISHEEGQNKVCDVSADSIKEKFTKDFKFEIYHEDDEGNPEIFYTETMDEFLKTRIEQCGSFNRGTIQNYSGTELSDPNIEDNKITFKATTSYCEYPFCMEGGKITNTIDLDFIIVKENGKWIISYYAGTR